MTLIPVKTKDLTNHIGKTRQKSNRSASDSDTGKAADENEGETRRPERRKTVLSFDASSCLAVGS